MSDFVVLPKQGTPLTPDRTSRAPYNFVPLPERVVAAVESPASLPRHDTYTDPTYPHSGWIEVRLTTKSPLFIRAPLTRTHYDYQESRPERDVTGSTTNTDFKRRVKNISNFFHRGDDRYPVIPGSTLRGMLRTLIEIAGYGKLTEVTERSLVYRAVGDTSSLGTWYRRQMLGNNMGAGATRILNYPSHRVHGGYLCKHHGHWAIRPARSDAATFEESLIHLDYGHAPSWVDSGSQMVHDVFIKPEPRRREDRGHDNLSLQLARTSTGVLAAQPGVDKPEGWLPAKLVVSGHMEGDNEKHMHCAIYEADETAPPILIDDAVWAQYGLDRDMTRASDRETRRLEKAGDPLFYLLDDQNNLVFFGPTMMFRIPYRNRVIDLVPPPLRNPVDIDLADAIFGYIRKPENFPSNALPPQGDRSRTYAGRVSVSDAVLETEENSEIPFTPAFSPRILASPKATAFQHYLVQSNDCVTDQESLSHYDSPTVDDQGRDCGEPTVIRGHKLYWHQGPRTIDQLRERSENWISSHTGEVKNNSTQHTRMRPVAPGKTFVCKIRFDNLSDVELGALCWALNPSGEFDKKYVHSIGMGKPFGMGAVSIEATLLKTDRNARYSRCFTIGPQAWETGSDTTTRLDITQPATRNAIVEPFERYVMTALGIGGENPPPLARLQRVAILLNLMEWPGRTGLDAGSYRPGPPGGDSDFRLWRRRPVLPSPLQVGGMPAGLVEPEPQPADQVADWSGRPPLAEPNDEPALRDVDTRAPDEEVPNEPSDPGEAIAAWSEDTLAARLTEDAESLLAAFAGREAQLIARIQQHHGACMERWKDFKGGKKRKAYVRFVEWTRRYDAQASESASRPIGDNT